MKKFKRIFLIVMDSAGIGKAKDAEKFGDKEHSDKGSNTFKHISEHEHFPNGLNIPTLSKMGIGYLDEIRGTEGIKLDKHAYAVALNEASNGKDTMTGHWEMMGILTTKPFQTFTDTGFPKELIDELKARTGHELIGNYSSSGTEILKVLGEECMNDNKLIVYTSSDSVLQLCGHEEAMGLEELYRCCSIARELCMKPEWFVGRVIARPFVGTNKDNFKRTSNRHDYTISPTGTTAMNVLKDNGYTVSCVGKINDIFNGVGVTETVHTNSNEDGMDKTIAICNSKDFKKGFCFVNLVEFDSEFGHRRNVIGYGEALERFDKRLQELIDNMNDDDLVMVTADHGNDPTWTGTDHTRERVPLLMYSKQLENGKILEERTSFADIGDTVLDNFGLTKADTMIGKSIKEIFE